MKDPGCGFLELVCSARAFADLAAAAMDQLPLLPAATSHTLQPSHLNLKTKP